MTSKISILATLIMILILTQLTFVNSAMADTWSKDDPKMQETIDQGPTTQATTGTSADCPSGQCPKYFAPGFHNDGKLIDTTADGKRNDSSSSPTVE